MSNFCIKIELGYSYVIVLPLDKGMELIELLDQAEYVSGYGTREYQSFDEIGNNTISIVSKAKYDQEKAEDLLKSK